MTNFSPVAEMRKGRRRVVARNSRNRSNIYSFGNSHSCITAVKWNACDVENTAGKARRFKIHSKDFIPVTGLKYSYGKIFQPAYRDPGWKNRDLPNRENFTKDSEVRRDLGNRAHVKRPLVFDISPD